MAKDEITLALALARIEELEKLHEDNAAEIKNLKNWKETCSKWAAWWAGVCAAVMTIATMIKANMETISHYFKGGQ
jgi:uncharacterized membrane protein